MFARHWSHRFDWGWKFWKGSITASFITTILKMNSKQAKHYMGTTRSDYLFWRNQHCQILVDHLDIGICPAIKACAFPVHYLLLVSKSLTVHQKNNVRWPYKIVCKWGWNLSFFKTGRINILLNKQEGKSFKSASLEISRTIFLHGHVTSLQKRRLNED